MVYIGIIVSYISSRNGKNIKPPPMLGKDPKKCGLTSLLMRQRNTNGAGTLNDMRSCRCCEDRLGRLLMNNYKERPFQALLKEIAKRLCNVVLAKPINSDSVTGSETR